MLEVGRRYKDSCDETRAVVPINAEGLCRIYFNVNDGKTKDGNVKKAVWAYVGNAHVPPRLFDASVCQVGWYGFTETYG